MREFIFVFIIVLTTIALVVLTQNVLYQNNMRMDTVRVIDTVRVQRDTVTIKFDTVKIYKRFYDTVYVDRVKVITADTSTCMSIDTLNDSVYVRAEICGKLTGKIDSLRGLISYKLPDQITIKEKVVLYDTIHKKTNYGRIAKIVGASTTAGIIAGIIIGVRIK
jgi:hypothetical protein